jgi:ornithine cyclodeaminase
MAHEVRIVTEAELRAALPLDLAAVDAVEAAFSALAAPGAVMPPVLSMHLPQVNGEVDVKTAWLPGFDGFAVKISPGFFDNPARGLPSLNGLMVLLSARTGLLEAVFLDNGYLTDLRTAAAGAVAARHLAPSRVDVAGVVGTGVQARMQIAAAHLVRPFSEVRVWGRDSAKAAACAADIAASLGVAARAESDLPRLMEACQLVVTTTPARSPMITRAMLHPGLHVTAMGSDQPGKNEIAADALVAADLYVCDRLAQVRAMGELRAALEAGLWSMPEPPELGQLVAGQRAGRASTRCVTICDLTGTGAQDTAIAAHALRALGSAGTRIEV